MGNCQAVDAASLVIQHPAGKSERLFWPIPASQIMKTNPGHCVALLLITTTTTTTTTTTVAGSGAGSKKSTVRITRVKLLRPTDILILGHVYRLISTQEVMKGLVAKKQAKMMKMKQANAIPQKSVVICSKEVAELKPDMAGAGRRSSAAALPSATTQTDKSIQMSKHEMQRQRSTSSSALRSKAWQPSLKSISESHS